MAWLSLAWWLGAAAASTPLWSGDSLPTAPVAFSSGAGRLELIAGPTSGSFGVAATSTAGGSPFHRAELKSIRIDTPILRGDVVVIEYAVRCSRPGSSTGRGRYEAYVQAQGPPWAMLGRFSGPVGRDWTRRKRILRSDRDWPAGSLEVAFQVGQYAQTLEFAELSGRNLGPDPDPAVLATPPVTYAGREPGAAWRRRAEASIDRHRKAALTVEVVDRDGRPVRSAKVEVRQQTHAYAFGAFLDTSALRTDADGERYRRTLLRDFNLVTLPIFAVDWWWGSPENQLKAHALAAWARDRGIRRRANNLVVPGWRWSPSAWRALESDPGRLQSTIEEDIRSRWMAFAPYGFEAVDAVTEPRANREFAELLGWNEVASWISSAERIASGPRWVLNEDTIVEQGGMTEWNQAILLGDLDRLRRGGAPITAIGLEARFDEELTDPAEVWRILDRMATPGLPISATEFSVDVGDERLQGDYVRDFLTVFFAHPATDAFIAWGFWEGQHWIPRAAWYRKDWSPKAAALAYRELVHDRWWTRADGRTDARGRFGVRAFKGDHLVTVRHNGRSWAWRARLAGDRILQLELRRRESTTVPNFVIP